MVVKQGARWGIEYGANILLLGPPWLKDGRSLTTDSPIYAALSHVKVKDIIEPTEKLWNISLISNLFYHHIVQLIMNTPLQPLVGEDKLIWKAKKHGNYFVRSAYRICVNEIIDNSHLHILGRWNLIWNLKVPPKIKKKCVAHVSGLFSHGWTS